MEIKIDEHHAAIHSLEKEPPFRLVESAERIRVGEEYTTFEVDGLREPEGFLQAFDEKPSWWRASACGVCCRWTGYILLSAIALTAAGLGISYLGPFILDKVLIPFMEWEEHVFDKPTLAIVAVASLAFLPIILMPTGPTMWLLGVVFGYLVGFVLIIIGQFFGQTFPYLIGHRFLHTRVQKWISKSPKHAVLLRLADSEGFWKQLQTVLLLRMSPIPYPIFNYAITATNIQYWPYIAASMTATVPEAFIAMYCGKLLQRLADMHQSKLRKPTTLEIVYESIGLILSVSVVLLGMYHGHKALRDLKNQETSVQEGVQLVKAAIKDEDAMKNVTELGIDGEVEEISSPLRQKFGKKYSKVDGAFPSEST